MGLLVIIALFGTYAAISASKITKTAFIPIIVNGAIITVLFIFALLAQLDTGVNLLLVLGLILTGITIFRAYTQQQYESLRVFIAPSFLFLTVATLFFWALLHNVRLTDYDNFSHWAVIVKNMSWQHGLPNTRSVGIQFAAYPPGSALFIYALCHFFGFTEVHAVLAQAFLISTAIMPLFNLVDRAFWTQKWQRAGLLAGVMLLLALNLYNGPSAMSSLLVDNLLLLTGLASTVIIIDMQQHPSRAAFCVWPLLTATVLIKNSGLFFTLINTVLLVIFLRRWSEKDSGSNSNRFSAKRISAIIGGVFAVLPYCFFWMWNQHVKHTFPNGDMSKHAVSLQDYITTFQHKSAGDIGTIAREILQQLFHFTNLHSAAAMVIWNAVGLLVLLLVLRQAKDSVRKSFKQTLIIIDTIFLAYVFGLFLMYVFSMPRTEALSLASFNRYLGTIMNYLIAWLNLSMLHAVQQLPKHAFLPVVASVICLVLTLTIWSGRSTLAENFSAKNYSGSRIARVDSALSKAGVTEDPMQTMTRHADVGMFAVQSQNPGAVLNYYLQYRFFAKHTSVYHDASAETYMANMMLKYKYFTIMSHDTHMADVMRTYFGITDRYWNRTYTAKELRSDYNRQRQGYPSN
jgi:hypothetical protein